MTSLRPSTDWRSLSRTELDAAYNNSEAVSNSSQIVEELARISGEYLEHRATARDVPYGPKDRQKIDLFANDGSNGTLFVFIHGGYWQQRNKETFAALAAGPLSLGCDVAMIGYTLAPDTSLTGIVEECQTAIAFLSREAGRFGIPAQRICVGGWSAGGHLATRMLELDQVTSAIAISGIFDLEPIRHCYLNDKLQLTPQEVEAQSPINRLDKAARPLAITYGEAELRELQRQSRMMADARLAHELPTECHPLPGLNHFTILDELAREDGAITKLLARQLEL